MAATTHTATPVQRNLFVVGAGLMGAGIAQVAACAGWQVTLHDTEPAALRRATAAIEESLHRFVAKGVMENAVARAARARITTQTSLDAAADAQLVVEAVIEDVN
ncbi:MAG: 3-hydroxyacyl-CoA dehydrogenase NAD-binding domain-containing protein, partial [Mycobacteriales bacterium]